jgi:hypothetical protein
MAISKCLSKWRESDLFEWLSENYYNLLVDTSKNFSKSDCYDIETKNRIELKCRATHYEKLIIEKPKYEYLIKESKKFADVPIYINSTPKGIYLFNLNDLKLEWFKKPLPKTTEFKNNNYISKEIATININKSKQLK